MALPITRYEQIAAVLVKYGFEVAVTDLLPNAIQWRLRKSKVDISNLSVNKRMKLAIQELGPTFVKFGQIMSTRRELLTPDLVEELKQLTDKVQPVPWDSVEPTIKAHVGNIDDVFVYLNKRPFAAASLSQAHHGKLKDGTVVVLKVQRPGIKAVIETDLRILKAIADQAEKTSSSLEIFNFPGMVTDFARQILSELDFVRDGKNADLFRKNMVDFEKVKIPKIYWQYSGERLLVMEYMRGVRIDKSEQIVKMGVDPKAIASLGLKVYMKQIFDDGFFHGDPHPGNLLITRNSELILLDFGLIGILRPEKRNLLMKMLMSILDKDVDSLTHVLTDLGMGVKDSWMDAFKDDLYLALISGDTYNEEQPDAGAVEGLISALRKYKLRVPMATMLMLKVISMVQDDAMRLYPRFDFIAEIKPLIAESFRKRVLNQANIRKTGLDFAEAIFKAKEIPDNVNLALKKISQGSFTWRIAHDDIDRLGNSIDRASYKIMLGMIIASVVVGTSLFVLATQEVLTLEGFQLTVAIYISAILIGLFVVLQIIRGRSKR